MFHDNHIGFHDAFNKYFDIYIRINAIRHWLVDSFVVPKKMKISIQQVIVYGFVVQKMLESKNEEQHPKLENERIANKIQQNYLFEQ